MNGQMYNHADIAWRLQNNAAISKQELAGHIAGDEVARLVFMVANNPANVNDTLRHDLGYGNLPFAPSTKEIIGQLNLLYKKGDEATLQHVIDNFSFNYGANNWTTDRELVELLKTQGVI